MMSTLSTGLNKSESFIKANAIRVHMRELTFYNNQKVLLDKFNEIPGEDTNGSSIKQYVRCLAINYFENCRICRHPLSIWLYYTNGDVKTTTITPLEIDQNGLLPQLSTLLGSIGIQLHYNRQINGYQGFKFSIDDISTIDRIMSNYHFAWILTSLINMTWKKPSRHAHTL